MADLVVKADGSVVKKETNNSGSLPLKESNVLDKPASKAGNTPGVSEYGSPVTSTKSTNNKLSIMPVIPNNIGMSDLVRILNEFSITLKDVKEAVLVVDKEMIASREMLVDIKKELELFRLCLPTGIMSINSKTVSCTINDKVCGSATYKDKEVSVTITLTSHDNIFLFDTSFAKIDTSLTLALEIDSKIINGKIIEKDNKYYLSFPKLSKYSDTPLEFVLPTI